MSQLRLSYYYLNCPLTFFLLQLHKQKHISQQLSFLRLYSSNCPFKGFTPATVRFNALLQQLDI